MKIVRTLGKQVLIETIAAKKESAGGIILPQGEKSGAKEGRVLVAANGLEVQPGDRVLYGTYAKTIDAGEGRVLVHADDIIAVIG